MKYFGWIFTLVIAMASCTKDKSPRYPDCFAEMEETHSAYISFGGGQVISLSDTSALTFYIDHEGLNLNEGCKAILASDLNEFSSVKYHEWKLYPDSVPPDFSSDLIFPNTSSSRFWNITSGTITSSVSPPDKDLPHDWRQISLQLTNAQFDRSQDGLPTVTINNLVVKDANTF